MGLSNIYNRQKNKENSRPYWLSDSMCAYGHTLESRSILQLIFNLIRQTIK